MAHQFGIDPLADGRWVAFTQATLLGGCVCGALFADYASPEAWLASSDSGLAGHPGLLELKRAVERADPWDPGYGLLSHTLHLLTPRDAQYPAWLRHCQDRPPFLYVSGDLSILAMRSLSVVGSRKPSLEGARAATEFAEGSAAAGLTIVSGLALGIDGRAHEGALAVGGTTIAVLPSGIDRIYPNQHRSLAQRIARQGCLVSEFPPGTPPRKHHFYRRNRTLSGLSEATLVVEAGRPSGTLLTASAAADQGREVMVLPWSIYHVGGLGCRYLLADGATLVQSVTDVLLHFGLAAESQASLVRSPSQPVQPLSREDRSLMQLIGGGVHSANDIAVALGWDLERCLARLSALELSGQLHRSAAGFSAR